jgi:hypothetical protein
MAGGEEEFLDEEAGEERRVVSKDAVFLEKIAFDQPNFEFKSLVAIDANGCGTFREVTASDFWGDRLAIGDDGIHDAAACVGLDGAKMVAERVARGFAGLGHKVGNINAGSSGAGNGVSNLRNKEIGDDAGVERTGAHEDEVGLMDSFDCVGKRVDATRVQRDFANGNLTARDTSLALDTFAVGEGRDQMNVRKCGGEDAAADGENLAGDADGFDKVTGHMGEGGKEEITEIVSGETTAGVKAILKETAEQGFVLGERDHAIADVAGGEHAIFAAEAAGAATVIGDGDDGGKIRDGPFRRGMLIAAADNMFLQTAEQRGETGAAAESDDAQAGGMAFLDASVFHVRLKCRNSATRWGAASRVSAGKSSPQRLTPS